MSSVHYNKEFDRISAKRIHMYDPEFDQYMLNYSYEFRMNSGESIIYTSQDLIITTYHPGSSMFVLYTNSNTITDEMKKIATELYILQQF